MTDWEKVYCLRRSETPRDVRAETPSATIICGLSCGDGDLRRHDPTTSPGGILPGNAVSADHDARFVFAAVVIEGSAAGNQGQALVFGWADDLLDGGGVELVEFEILHPIDLVDEDRAILAGNVNFVAGLQF